MEKYHSENVAKDAQECISIIAAYLNATREDGCSRADVVNALLGSGLREFLECEADLPTSVVNRLRQRLTSIPSFTYYGGEGS